MDKLSFMKVLLLIGGLLLSWYILYNSGYDAGKEEIQQGVVSELMEKQSTYRSCISGLESLNGEMSRAISSSTFSLSSATRGTYFELSDAVDSTFDELNGVDLGTPVDCMLIN